MKKLKLIIVLIILALVTIFAFQNQDYFKQTHQLSLDLILAGPYTTPVLNNATICIAAFLLGVIIAYLLTLTGRIKQRKSIKTLNYTLNDRQNEIVTLKTELETQKPSAPSGIPPDEVIAPPKEGDNA